MDLLFIHPSFPGQYARLAPKLALVDGISVCGMGDIAKIPIQESVPNIPVIRYAIPGGNESFEHPNAKNLNHAMRRAHAVFNTLLEHKRQGYEPDVIFVHTGWGDSIFLRDVYPAAKIIGLFEYYYSRTGADVGFDSEFPKTFNDIFHVRGLNALPLMALESCDRGICPTEWQRSRFPEVYQPRLDVIHDGIDTELVKPDPDAVITLADGKTFSAGDEVLTYVSRDLEPYRGYHIFMRSLPEILSARPNCHVVIVGGDGVSYGRPAPQGETWKQKYLEEVADRIDLSRVHFTGKLPYSDFLKVLQISRAHVYLTYPFVLSWSMLEAMSAGCLVIGSATPPVEEVICHGKNGLLVPFRDFGGLACVVIDALARPDTYLRLREDARKTVVEKYDFRSVSLPSFLRLIQSLEG
ncbi:glycosyltransferase family 4 protein [Azonexus sp.]|uniref:glycosyltransferase family 4 protein n=1 Tax=Azonexus sp. TaxID=1872668 RepID=UPI0027B9E999|nr:glycosyltransferase family 4 protein [Azonexus sp.]